eukprot:m.182674 g.182674  ORF g.182674 m.182674 type:complete len:517 (+) comp15600_c0_seq1:67-1617(+)
MGDTKDTAPPVAEETAPPSKEALRAMIEQRAQELEAATSAASSQTNTTKEDHATGGDMDATVDPGFTAAPAYDGSRPGFVYKAGPQGTGYYTDTQGRLLKALSKLEAEVAPQAAAERALEAKPAAPSAVDAHASQGDATDVPDGESFDVTFSDAKWGMVARMVSGPIAVTKVREGGQAAAAGVKVGDVVAVADGIAVVKNRSQAIARLRAGGKGTLTFVRPKEPVASVGGLVSVGDAHAVTKTLDGSDAAGNTDWSVKKMQAMIGGAKAKDTVAMVGKTGVTETVVDGAVHANATLVFIGCEDCTFTLESYCIKVYVQDCKNLTINAKTRIITSTVEVFKGENVRLNFDTDCGTLQADMVNGLHAHFNSKDRLTMAVWAGCEDVVFTFGDTDERFETGFTSLATTDATLNRERSQFKVSRLNGRLIQEKVIRLENGFTTTQREKAEFELKQEASLKAMASQMGITIGRKADGVKVKPNEPCPCGSGLKFKKCCFSVDGIYKGDATKTLPETAAAPV